MGALMDKKYKRTLTYNGETRTLGEWAEITGLTHQTICKRISLGWTTEEILKKPTQRETTLTAEQVYHRLMAWEWVADGTWWPVSKVSTWLHIKPTTVRPYLEQLVDQNKLDKRMVGGTIEYKKKTDEWLRKPWRKTVPPMIYGSPTWV